VYTNYTMQSLILKTALINSYILFKFVNITPKYVLEECMSFEILCK